MGKYGVTVTEAEPEAPRRGKYGTIVAEAQPEPAAPAPATDDYAKPNVVASAIQGFGEGMGVGGLARRITAAGRTVLPEMLGGNDMSYDENLQREESRIAGAAEGHPAVTGAAQFAGTVAPFAASAKFLAGAKVAAGASRAEKIRALAGRMAATGALGGAQVAAKGGDAGDVATGAGLGALYPAATAARALPYVGKVAAATPLGVNTLMSGQTLLDPNATPAQKWEAGFALAAPFAAEGVGYARGKGADLLQEQAAKAERLKGRAEQEAAARVQQDLDALGQKRARQTDEYVGAQESQAKETFDAETRRMRREAANERDRLTTADDATQRAYNEAKAAKDAKRKFDNDMFRLADAAHKIERIDLAESVAKAQAEYDAQFAAAKTQAERVNAEIDRAAKLGKIEDQITAEYNAKLESLAEQARGEGLTPEEAMNKAVQTLRAQYGETYTRTGKMIKDAEAGITQPTPEQLADMRANYKHTADSLVRNTPESVSSVQAARETSFGARAQQIANDLLAKANAGDPKALAELERLRANPPDAKAQAADTLAAQEKAKATLTPAQRARVDEALRANGIDPATVTDAQILEGLPAPDVGARPTMPSDAPHQRVKHEFTIDRIMSGNEPLPPKPDRPATRQTVRESAAAVRNRDFVPPETNVDTTPMGADDFRARVERAIATGRDNVNTGLQGPSGSGRSITDQYVRELPENPLKEVARTAAGAGTGGLVGFMSGSGVGALAGSVLGAAASRKLARPRESYMRSEFLGESNSPAGVLEGEAQRLQFTKPNAAAAIYREVAPDLRARADVATNSANTQKNAATAASLEQLLNDPDFRERLRQYLATRGQP